MGYLNSIGWYNNSSQMTGVLELYFPIGTTSGRLKYATRLPSILFPEHPLALEPAISKISTQ